MSIAAIEIRPAPRGLLLVLTSSDGRVGLGEASPLPGYSPDDLGSCRAALARLDPEALSELEADGTAFLGELARASRAIGPELPAARHALETALADLAAQRRGEPLWALLARALGPRDVPSLVALCALIDGDDEAALVACAERELALGIRTLKLKLGRRSFAEDLARVAAVRRAIGAAGVLRLDVNQRWDKAFARRQLGELLPYRPELVEECLPASELGQLAGSSVPLALDESLQRASLADLENLNEIRALVLKPMALGGFSRCLELARFASRRGLDCIVSHVFDGPVALAAAAHLALAIGSGDRAAGLAPHAGLSHWPRVELPLVSGAHVIADDAPGLGLAPSALAA